MIQSNDLNAQRKRFNDLENDLNVQRKRDSKSQLCVENGELVKFSSILDHWKRIIAD